MATSRARAALDSWLVRAEAVLQGSDEPDTLSGLRGRARRGW